MVGRRYNNFQSDPESRGDPSYSIAARSDLDRRRPSLNGAVDAKCVDAALVSSMRTMAISGPTAQNQPPFSFDGSSQQGSSRSIRHEGMPQTFRFDWYAMDGFRPASSPLTGRSLVTKSESSPHTATTTAWPSAMEKVACVSSR